MNNTSFSLDAYRRRTSDQPVNASTSLGGMPGAAPGLAQAQSAIHGIGGTIKKARLPLAIGGGLTALAGIAMTFLVGFGTGSTMILTGIVTAIGGWFVFPRFLAGELSAFKGEFAMIDELAAQAQLAQTGIPMKARILNMAPTGTTINHSPQVSAALEVQGPNGPYLVGTMAVVSPMYIPQFQPGATVTVRVNPQNLNEVAVVF